MGVNQTAGQGGMGMAGTGTVFNFQTCTYTVPVSMVYGYATGMWLSRSASSDLSLSFLTLSNKTVAMFGCFEVCPV